jgi:hypothetical protein
VLSGSCTRPWINSAARRRAHLSPVHLHTSALAQGANLRPAWTAADRPRVATPGVEPGTSGFRPTPLPIGLDGLLPGIFDGLPAWDVGPCPRYPYPRCGPHQASTAASHVLGGIPQLTSRVAPGRPELRPSQLLEEGFDAVPRYRLAGRATVLVDRCPQTWHPLLTGSFSGMPANRTLGTPAIPTSFRAADAASKSRYQHTETA